MTLRLSPERELREGCLRLGHLLLVYRCCRDRPIADAFLDEVFATTVNRGFLLDLGRALESVSGAELGRAGDVSVVTFLSVVETDGHFGHSATFRLSTHRYLQALRTQELIRLAKGLGVHGAKSVHLGPATAIKEHLLAAELVEHHRWLL